ncbi:replication restart helicase PriA [Bdellovibrio svalbardensis]|uniref:Replication restart protein PriA n=1 Tax=Bdellovibrio svalbardensis TaxID=2972972 RepID=A0ABT6DDX6_9BACT|nr:primosomal protein N' [Bdellovibrio svalbardensis]MDG0815051.1 primosomal protein N' [Bdellovibrio svalbardensis]
MTDPTPTKSEGSQSLWKVAVDAPLPEALTYSYAEPLQRGQLVNVPLGKRKVKGLVLGPAAPTATASEFKIKSIDSIDEEYRPLPAPFVNWLEWLGNYYLHPVGQVVQSAFPPLRKTEKQRASKRAPVIPQLDADTELNLTDEQRTCFESISKYSGFSTHLLFGVTGSGKTEVYLRLLDKVLKEGKRGLVLVPEISLTPQLVQRFARRFGDKIAAMHSQLTEREKTNQWWDMVDGKKSILIGARSALFCPIEDLGLIIVDEEHEPSFKQDEKLKYNGRDAAVMMGKMMNCPVVLGSATPSLETWKNAQEGKYHLHTLKNRVAGRALPTIEVIDLRQQKADDDQQKLIIEKYSHLPFWLSPALFEKMNEVLDQGDQAALFLNRRGVAQMVVCPACGHTRECPNCDISLTLHAGSHLICHYCDYHENMKARCPDCKEGEMEAIGLGTELLEKDLSRLFPGKRIARADRDEIQSRADLEDLISDMETGAIDILVGTQMIAKGLDFPKLKLVGLVLADVGFNLPDFRATERSFQLITQMSGRSGRHVKEGESPGYVIIQTFNTEHESITFARNHDYEGFANNELSIRGALNYPPVGRLVGFRIQGPHLGKVEEAARLLARRAQSLKTQFPQYSSMEVLGPAEAPLSKLRGQFRYHLLLKTSQNNVANPFSRQLLGDQEWVPSGVKILVDIDPMNLL